MADRQVEIQADLDRLKGDITRLREDFGELFETAMALGKDGAGTAKDKLSKGVEELKKAAEAAKAKGGKAVENVQDCISDRPITSVLVAFAAGVVIARLLDRR